jgi:hypothetical protein
MLAAMQRLSPKQQRALAQSLSALVDELGIGDEAARMLFDDDPPRRKRANKRA